MWDLKLSWQDTTPSASGPLCMAEGSTRPYNAHHHPPDETTAEDDYPMTGRVNDVVMLQEGEACSLFSMKSFQSKGM